MGNSYSGTLIDNQMWLRIVGHRLLSACLSINYPMYIHQRYGNRQVLTGSYAMMTKYVGYLTDRAKNHLLSYGLSDWYNLETRCSGESQFAPKGSNALVSPGCY